MKNIITIQHTQSVHHTNGMVGSWTDWDLSELGTFLPLNMHMTLTSSSCLHLLKVITNGGLSRI